MMTQKKGQGIINVIMIDPEDKIVCVQNSLKVQWLLRQFQKCQPADKMSTTDILSYGHDGYEKNK